MKAEIKSPDINNEYETEERCSILEISNSEDDSALSIAQARVKPETTTAWHQLSDIEERYIIISGTGRVQVGDSPPTEVQPGDVVKIPANTPQRIENIGTCDLIFYALCTPRFTPDAYLHLEKNQSP